MFDFIPVEIYSGLFYNLILLLSLISSLYILSSPFNSGQVKTYFQSIGIFLLIFSCLYIGARQPSHLFGDTIMYATGYYALQRGEILNIKNDYIFNYFMVFSSSFMSVRMFFFVIGLFYVVPMYLFCKKYCGSYWGLALLMCIASFSFWPYGVNGIRNGMATSVFILGLYFYQRKLVMYSLFALSFGIHNSLMIPIAAFIASGLYRNPKIYFYIWLACVPLSIIGGGFWGNFFATLGLGDDRAGAYLDAGAISGLAKKEGTTFSSTGFRWDFLLYSASGVFAGWYFLVKNKVQDRFYIHLWGVYMIANAFWILVIRAAFSNRFAYLSWFLLSLVIIYPLVKYRFSRSQEMVLSAVLAAYYGFTYFMFLKS